ncbi:hypothetical protein [Methylosinus sporium]|uniref:hypothetical protein n=1 Tax=Methylosinus sporium TaxID=428 RepID=UPI001304AF1B|nr:hypothetical protein [Methylosinus sporium]
MRFEFSASRAERAPADANQKRIINAARKKGARRAFSQAPARAAGNRNIFNELEPKF